MTPLKRILLSFLAALALWAFFAWPIPRDMTAGIPSSSLNVEKGGKRAMIPGDQLQLLYQFWLTGDTLKGHTPAFVNPYEFNVGKDADGAFRGTYYVPFSLFYTLGEVIGGRAFGYNVDHLVTVWMTFLFLWLLVHRYCRDEGLAAVAALVGAGLPYAWIAMFDGSPTGLAMMWIPLIYWALDVMVAERKAWAGLVAGAAICLAESDSHVFFFAILSSPVWCALSYLNHFPGQRPSWPQVRALLRSAVFLAAFLGIAVWQVWVIRHSIRASTLTVSSRSIEEIRAGSPTLSGLVKCNNPGDSRKIYVSGYLVAILALGSIVVLGTRSRKPSAPAAPLRTLALLGLGIAGVALLATGVRSPLGPRAWKVVMTLIPPYAVIRQPHKIFCLMPALLALASGILLPCLLNRVSNRWRTLAGLAVVLPLLLDYGFRIRPTVCILDREQGAFRAIAEDAKATGNARPDLLSLPIWPGDSHYDSLNEYYVSLYGLRMVNGYGGTVRIPYRDNIFQPLESMNVGAISDSQLDFLLKRSVGYLVLHEDCFPEKVSPFPVGHTLESLLNHPRLTCIGKDAAVWSFKILPADQADVTRNKTSFMKYYFSARRFDFADLRAGNDGVKLSVGKPVDVRPSSTPLSLPLSWMVRARGQGTFKVSNVIAGVTNAPTLMDVTSPGWTWNRLDIESGTGAAGVGATIAWASGSCDLDSVLLAAGDWTSPAPGHSLELPAVCFFHAGYSDRAGECVTLRAAYEPDSIVFYGPKLPLDPGRYSAELNFESPALTGTELGQVDVRWEPRGESAKTPVIQGRRSVTCFEQKDNQPFYVAFEFLRTADIRIRSVTITRLADR